MTSVTAIYSYMTIESFANYHLYEIWEQSRFAHNKIERIKDSHSLKGYITTAIFDNFYKNYGHIEKFEDLRKTDLRDLKTRLKVLCEELEIRKIHEVDPLLWQDFNSLLLARNFLIHPIPNPKEFQTMMKNLLMKTEGGKYVNVAERVK
ncbi:MAG: hypothetical protein IIB95_10720 [Candidatus Marinimicrobia bacterium]|nr:hypothetical protein [Candidatus Neomarinimicrobiota bacterium]